MHPHEIEIIVVGLQASDDNNFSSHSVEENEPFHNWLCQ